jgi:hypothetical protein
VGTDSEIPFAHHLERSHLLDAIRVKAEAVPEGPAAGTESAADVPMPPPTSERREAPLPQPAEAAETTAVVVATDAVVVVVSVVGSSPSCPVATCDDEVHVPNKPVAAVHERIAPEDTTRAASPEIQEVEEAGAVALMGASGSEVQSLELACTSWATTSGSGDDAEDDEEAAARNTLECGLNWAHHAFDELILPATSVSFLN